MPHAPGRGPWVVRVDVVDDLGQSIGRNFVEVAATAKPRRVVRD
jgi:hypothetical protein